MKERPILMTPANAQKCHEGTKTQTRRIISVPSWVSDDDMLKLSIQRPATGIAYYEDGIAVKRLTCPYGVVGDRLWVRENGWERPARTAKMLRDGADTWERFYFDALLDAGESEELKGYGFKRRPSIHMPRRACRTVLEIAEVCVERVQDITQLDAMHEGCDGPDYISNFYELWESINGVGAWGLNPWVWALSFRRVGA